MRGLGRASKNKGGGKPHERHPNQKGPVDLSLGVAEGPGRFHHDGRAPKQPVRQLTQMKIIRILLLGGNGVGGGTGA